MAITGLKIKNKNHTKHLKKKYLNSTENDNFILDIALFSPNI